MNRTLEDQGLSQRLSRRKNFSRI